MFNYNYKYGFYLISKKWGRFHFFLNFDTLYSGGGGGGKSPLPLDIFASYIPDIQNFILLYCRMPLHTCNV